MSKWSNFVKKEEPEEEQQVAHKTTQMAWGVQSGGPKPEKGQPQQEEPEQQLAIQTTTMESIFLQEGEVEENNNNYNNVEDGKLYFVACD